MKHPDFISSNTPLSAQFHTLILVLLSMSILTGQEMALQEAAAEELTNNQDNLSADVQELVELQTQLPVIEKLEEVEKSMVSATLKLLENNTSQETLTIQTDIIEKAYEAAKEKSKSQGKGQSDTNKAMMDMLNKMLGKQEAKPSRNNSASGEGSGEEPTKPESGQEEESDNAAQEHQKHGSKRTVPAASAYSGQLLPEEFREHLESYNTNAE